MRILRGIVMRHLAGSLCSLSLGFSAFCHAVLAEDGPTPQAPEAVIFRTTEGSQHFAVAVRGTSFSDAISRHVILIDTSASQIGKYRDQSLSLLEALVGRIPAGHSVMVAAVDSDFESLTDGFVSAGSNELHQAVKSLKKRTPLGATSLAEALRNVHSTEESQPMSVLYIGDGMSAANQLSLSEVDALCDSLIERSIVFHGLLLGPKVDNQLTGILANLTGGTLKNAGEAENASLAQEMMTRAAIAPQFVSNVRISVPNATLASPERLAVRPDRETVVFGKGAVPNQVTLTAQAGNGDSLSWTTSAESARTAGGELRVFFDRANQSSGVHSAIVGVERLEESSQQFETLISTAVETAERFRQAGQNKKAIAVTRQAMTLDATHPLLTSMAVTLQDETPGSAEDRLGPPLPDEGDQLSQVEARNQIVTQQLVQSTSAAIEEANRVAAEQPEYALSLLKDLLDTVRSSTEIAPEKREELERRIVNAYSRVNQARQVNEIAQRERAQRQANQEQVRNLLEASQLEEQTLQTLIAQVRGLLDRARHGDSLAYEKAEVAGRMAVDLKPGNGTASSAVIMAETAGQLFKAYELVNLRHDRFLETLYQVELSHVPFPDEPPIQYPPADVWRALSLSRREKYESVSLRSEKPVELWLEQMLDEPIPLLDYGNNASLREILDAIETHFNLTGDYTMRIILDESDPDIGDDPEYLENTQVSGVNYKGITLRNALKLILAKVKDQELTYMIKNEVMMITTVATAESEENLITRVYQVADLVVQTIAQQGGQGGQGGIGGGQGGFGGQQGGGFGGGGQGGFGGGGAFSIAPEPVQPAGHGLNFGGAKKKPAQ
jgi:hypothetical protein